MDAVEGNVYVVFNGGGEETVRGRGLECGLNRKKKCKKQKQKNMEKHVVLSAVVGAVRGRQPLQCSVQTPTSRLLADASSSGHLKRNDCPLRFRRHPVARSLLQPSCAVAKPNEGPPRPFLFVFSLKKRPNNPGNTCFFVYCICICGMPGRAEDAEGLRSVAEGETARSAQALASAVALHAHHGLFFFFFFANAVD